MANQQPFISACLSQPDEDLPKLVFADWLEEQGNTRAAWRLRQYLGVYRQSWKGVIRWEILDRLASNQTLIEEVVAKRRDDLWRLVALTFFEVVQTREPLPFEPVVWQRGWHAERYRQALAEAKCRITLYACGLRADLVRARSAAQAAEDAMVSTQDPIQAAEVLRNAAYATRLAGSTADLARLATMTVAHATQGNGWSAAMTLWRHIHATDPGW